MKSNITKQQYFGGDLQLTEPHFDEEATLLSARRVVPLREVRTEPRSGRRLVFGMAMVVAVMVGAFGATLIYKHGQKQGTAIVETSIPLPEPAEPADQPVAGAGGYIFDSNTSSVAENAGDLTKREVRKAGVLTEAGRSAALFSARPGRAKETLQNEAGNENELDERELRRAERGEARRLRRIAARESKRETRYHKGQSSDDLLRIREIFEGSPRP